MFDKDKLKNFAMNIGEKTKETIDSTVQKIDQNNMDDIKSNASEFIKQKGQQIKGSVNDMAKNIELNTLRPIFIEDLKNPTFVLTKFIRVSEPDRKHQESSLCDGSIGYYIKNDAINIYANNVKDFGIKLYPDDDAEFYFVDPYDDKLYIYIDDYFSYLKSSRINELEKIAQDLGAKHFKITYKEKQKSFSNHKDNSSNIKFFTNYVTVDMSIVEHAPIKPQLKYLERDQDINHLIDMRMDENSPLLNQTLLLKLSQSTDMKEKDAMLIDAVYKGLKCSSEFSVLSELKNESCRYLEYEIEF